MYANSRFITNSRSITRYCGGNLHYRSQHMTKVIPQRCLHKKPGTVNPGTRKIFDISTQNRVLRQLSLGYGGRNGVLSDRSLRLQSRSFASGAGSGDESSSAASAAGGDDDASGPKDEANPGVYIHQDPSNTTALVQQNVPDFVPNVPIIAVKRHVLFPKFLKFMDVSM